MLRRTPLITLALAALALAPLTASAATPSPWLHFEAKPVKPGNRLHAWTQPCKGTGCNAMQIYFVPAAAAKAGEGRPVATGAVQVGRIKWHKGKGLGTLDIVVPK